MQPKNLNILNIIISMTSISFSPPSLCCWWLYQSRGKSLVFRVTGEETKGITVKHKIPNFGAAERQWNTFLKVTAGALKETQTDCWILLFHLTSKFLYENWGNFSISAHMRHNCCAEAFTGCTWKLLWFPMPFMDTDHIHSLPAPIQPPKLSWEQGFVWSEDLHAGLEPV